MVTYRRRLAPLLVLLPGFACGSDDGPNPIRAAFAQADAPVTATPSVAFRFPAEAGDGVRLYTLPAVKEAGWKFETPDLVARRVVGFAADEDLIYVQPGDSGLIVLDLTSGQHRVVDTTVVAAAIGPTGIPHLVRSEGSLGTAAERRVDDWTSTFSLLPSRIWGTTRGRLVGLIETEEGRRLEVLGESDRVSASAIPDGRFALTAWVDLIAVATDTGVVGINTADGSPAGRMRLETEVTALAFSTAGHRLYLVTAAGELIVLGRFEFTELSRLALPGAASAIRAGRQGRYLLLRPAARDSIWILDALDFTHVRSVPGSWDDDLPAISRDGTVLVRQGDDVASVDPATGVELGRIDGGAGDRWITIAWDPRRPDVQLAQEEERVEREGLTDQIIFIQVSSTSNESWAQARVVELRNAGLDAQVLQPAGLDDRYRVVIGPFDTIEEAHDIGRRLGQAYFPLYQQKTTSINQ